MWRSLYSRWFHMCYIWSLALIRCTYCTNQTKVQKHKPIVCCTRSIGNYEFTTQQKWKHKLIQIDAFRSLVYAGNFVWTPSLFIGWKLICTYSYWVAKWSLIWSTVKLFYNSQIWSSVLTHKTQVRVVLKVVRTCIE
jgi:hypothetical protein